MADTERSSEEDADFHPSADEEQKAEENNNAPENANVDGKSPDENDTLPFDAEIHKWANEKLGNGFTRDSVDFSDISIKQRALVYHKLEDFLTVDKCFEEEFDNPGNMSISWVYLQDFTAESKLTWQISNGFESKYLPIKDIKIEAPPVDKNLTKLDTVLTTLRPGTFSVENATQHVFNMKRSVTVAPYSEARAYTELRTWQLSSCRFYCDVVMSGFVKIIGHRKRKNWMTQEVKAGIEDFFINREGFDVIKTYDSEPEVVYKMLGACTGNVVAGAKVHAQELETTV